MLGKDLQQQSYRRVGGGGEMLSDIVDIVEYWACAGMIFFFLL